MCLLITTYRLGNYVISILDSFIVVNIPVNTNGTGCKGLLLIFGLRTFFESIFKRLSFLFLFDIGNIFDPLILYLQ